MRWSGLELELRCTPAAVLDTQPVPANASLCEGFFHAHLKAVMGFNAVQMAHNAVGAISTRVIDDSSELSSVAHLHVVDARWQLLCCQRRLLSWRSSQKHDRQHCFALHPNIAQAAAAREVFVVTVLGQRDGMLSASLHSAKVATVCVVCLAANAKMASSWPHRFTPPITRRPGRMGPPKGQAPSQPLPLGSAQEAIDGAKKALEEIESAASKAVAMAKAISEAVLGASFVFGFSAEAEDWVQDSAQGTASDSPKQVLPTSFTDSTIAADSHHQSVLLLRRGPPATLPVPPCRSA